MTDAFRLKPTFAARIWGRADLNPWYSETGIADKVGEAWLTGPGSLVETGEFAGKTLTEISGGKEFPLLVKMLFPDEKLSVQVHPDDEQAQALGLARGKTECWYVLQAESGATVACGLLGSASTEDVASAVREEKLEKLMRWLPVEAGDMIFVDAGTVHAIGPGVTLLEVQQTCDVTYRLYDYGRPRELHLEAGLAVTKTRTAAGKIVPVVMDGFTRLIASKYFVVDRYDLAAEGLAQVGNISAGCIVGLSGSGRAAGIDVLPGQAVVLPVGVSQVESHVGLSFAWCWEPPQA